MGVTGCGKTTVGMALAERTGAAFAELSAEFADADDFHPESNKAKMAAGNPLDDNDRWPWLEDVADWLAVHDNGVMACSALKYSYRELLRAKAGDIFFVHLEGPQSVLEERVIRRQEKTGHFAPAGILDGQYRDLEPLQPGERGVTISVARNSPRKTISLARKAVRQA
jgi:carbohydrate kinase (thermoresistant glucokinase family)